MSLKETFRALSDPVRRGILERLKKEKLTAGEIAVPYKMTAPAISYHLNILKKAGLVRESKYKNYIYYELNMSVFEELVMWLGQFRGEDETDEKE